MADKNKSVPKLIYESPESLYKKAVKVMEADELIVQFAYKRDNFLKAADMFKEVGDYLDAPELETKCRQLAEEATGKETEYKYKLAHEQKRDSRNAKDFEKAEKLFAGLSGYKDSEEQRRQCADQVTALKKKRKRKTVVVLCILLAIAALLAVFFTSPGWTSLKNWLMGQSESEQNEQAKQTQKAGETKEADAITVRNGNAGDMVTFGNHSWYILERNGSQVKMIMAQAEKFEEFRHTPYHGTQEDVTWETCSLRAWLNSDFLENDFSEEDRGKILEMDIKNEDNSTYGTAGGNDTKDKVSLLSAAEVAPYKETLNHIRMNIWLRTPGNAPDTAAFMASTNVAMEYGYPVTSENFYTCPVIWVSTE